MELTPQEIRPISSLQTKSVSLLHSRIKHSWASSKRWWRHANEPVVTSWYVWYEWTEVNSKAFMGNSHWTIQVCRTVNFQNKKRRRLLSPSIIPRSLHTLLSSDAPYLHFHCFTDKALSKGQTGLHLIINHVDGVKIEATEIQRCINDQSSCPCKLQDQPQTHALTSHLSTAHSEAPLPNPM